MIYQYFRSLSHQKNLSSEDYYFIIISIDLTEAKEKFTIKINFRRKNKFS